MNIFDKMTNRENTNAIKWDSRKEVFGESEVLPLWVADMDFETPKEIVDALVRRAEHKIFGYTCLPDELFDSIINWNKTRHNWDVKREDLFLNNSVLSSLNILLRILTNENDGVLMFNPVYYPFFKIAKQIHRKVIFSNLIIKDREFEIDFDALEETFKNEKPKVLIFCNPHNPGGKIWAREDLKQLIELCKKYQVFIISDDIHKDIVFKNQAYLPIETIDASYLNSIATLSAPTKTFNIAGIQSSFAIIHDTEIKRRFQLELVKSSTTSLNVFAIEATIAAYGKCAYWVDLLNTYLEENFQLVEEELKDTRFKCMNLQGTYLVWIDYSAFQMEEKEIEKLFISNGLGVQMGSMFGSEGDQHFRVNIGTQKATLQKALDILKKIDLQVN